MIWDESQTEMILWRFMYAANRTGLPGYDIICTSVLEKSVIPIFRAWFMQGRSQSKPAMLLKL
jgi:hypothetical protein